MTKTKQPKSLLSTLFGGEEVRRTRKDGTTWYAAEDVIGFLTDSSNPAGVWADLKRREPQLATLVDLVDFNADSAEVVDAEGVLRLAQSIPSGKAERLKRWLARSARQRLEEMENPELALVRMRSLYEHKGYPRRWTDKRLRGMAARQELTSEWYRRGASESEQFRELTNEIVASAFGMDVNAYRRYKNLQRPAENLRDSMNDLELVLTMLGETAAVALHRQRDSHGFQQLLVDAADAGQIAATTRAEIEDRGASVITPGRYVERPAEKVRPE